MKVKLIVSHDLNWVLSPGLQRSKSTMHSLPTSRAPRARDSVSAFERCALYSFIPVLHLGRTHQLRVHCSAAGHPIVGDFTYSFKKDSNPYRMMLHASYLRIPTRKELIEVNAPDPFLTSLDSNWVPHHTVHRLDEMLQELKDKTIRVEEEERNQEALLRSGGEEMPSKAKSLETEEERAQCEQWLAEWALA